MKIEEYNANKFLTQFSSNHNHSHDKCKKITIIGGGAVGSYFAWLLVEAEACNKVTILGRPNSAHLTELQSNGLVVHTSDGIKTIPAEKFSYIGSFNYNIAKQDLIIVSLKQPDFTVDVAKQINYLSNSNTIVAIITNGIPFYYMQCLDIKYLDTKCLDVKDLDGKNVVGKDLDEKHLSEKCLDEKYLHTKCKSNIVSIDPNGEIIKELKNSKLIGVQPVIAAEKIANGKIKITRDIDKISVVVGAILKNNSEFAEKIFDVFTKAKIKTTISSEPFQKHILEKLQFALSINVLSALMDKSIDNVFIASETQPFIKYVINLLDNIAYHSNISKLRDYKQFKNLQITKGHYSSLHKDIHNGKQSESAAIVDSIIELSSYFNYYNSSNSYNSYNYYNSKHSQNDKNCNNNINLQPLIFVQELLNKKIKDCKISVSNEYNEELQKLFDMCTKLAITNNNNHNNTSTNPAMLRSCL